jgi:tetratricopeptide (TPR) repeat protein
MACRNPSRIRFVAACFALLCVLGAGVATAQNPASGAPDKPLSDAEFDALIANIDEALGVEKPEAPVDSAAAGDAAATPDAGERSASEAFVIRALRDARQRIPQGVGPLLEDVRNGRISESLQAALFVLLAIGVVTLAVLRLLRGRGDLAINIHYPSELRGTFNVRVSKRRPSKRARRRARNPQAVANPQKSSASRLEHTMVARETRFRDLLARRYCVMVYGFIQPIEGEDVIATHLDEQEVRIRRGGTERLDFDFQPKECSVDVRVLWDRQPANDAMVALRRVPASLRYARGGPVRLSLSPGSYTLVIGCGDRVAERPLEIDSMQPMSIEVDLTGRDALLFNGCPPAVQPYLNGELTAAARALERDGQDAISHEILARMHHEQGTHDAAAKHYEAAGQLAVAAELYESLSQFDKAAELFEQVDEPARAAAMFQAAGDLSRAGIAFERANRLEDAVECYRDADDISRWTTALERSGQPLEAANVAIERDDWGRAIRSLQQVPLEAPDYVEATNLLIDAYQRSGHLDLALHKTEELVHNQGVDGVEMESIDRLSQLLEESGELDRALSVLELIRRRDATWPNVATRIEGLNKRINEDATTGGVTANGDAFGEGSRYELTQELGRGGMGVVYRARDRRLGRVVALKRLPENLQNHPKAVQLFLREARSAAALNHPNIVTLYDAGQEEQILYITMELLEGLPLVDILRKRGQLTARDTARLGIQIANGLQYAHEKRIIHRDIKTGNLFFTDSRKVKIMDFGLAKMVEEVRRASTVIGGTPYYMAPEQSLGGAVDHRVDLYALGVTFYELLTGRVPFVDGDVAYHHRHTQPKDPREFIDTIPEAFAELVLQMLEKEPYDRVPHAQEVADRLAPLAKSTGRESD